jgi:hypothetical protein
MHAIRAARSQTSPIQFAGALFMLAGAALYLVDQGAARSWHLFTWPALVTMGFGALLAFVGGEREDR